MQSASERKFDNKPSYTYQSDLVKKVLSDLLSHKKVVLAACPGAGKTRMAVEVIKSFLKDKTFKVLILTHGQTLLRRQWVDVFDKLKLHYDYVEFLGTTKTILDNKKLLLKKWQNHQVIVSLPQTLWNMEDLPKVDLLIIDEAHHYAESNVTKKLIERISPKYELRLTGTPSIYTDNSEWKIHGVTIQELLEYNVLVDPQVELCKSYYTYKMSDYTAVNTLSEKVRFTNNQTVHTISDLISNYGRSFFLKKTMIVARNQSQAVNIEKYLQNEGFKTSLSISKKGYGFEELNEFKTNSDTSIFIVVNRGILGFDFDQLVNLIDMSCSLNVNRLFQMLCRVVRRHPHQGIKKRFIKVSSNETAIFTQYCMSFVIALSDPQYYYSYATDNKNIVQFPIRKELMDKIKELKKSNSLINPDKFPILPEVFCFREIAEIRKGNLSIYAKTTFKELKNFIKNKSGREYTLEIVLDLARDCKSRAEFRKTKPGAYYWLINNNLLSQLDQVLPRKNRLSEWTIKSASEDIKKYPTKSQFREANHGAFKFLKKNAPHLLKFKKKFNRWTEETALKEAKNFRNSVEFRKSHFKQARPGAYEFLKRELSAVEFDKLFFRDNHGQKLSVKKG